MAKSVRPYRLRQQPPEVRCWSLTGRHALSGSRGALLCHGFSEPCVRVGLAHGSNKPRRLACGAVLLGCCLLGVVAWQAAGVSETVVGDASVGVAGHLVGEELAVDRLAGDGEPLFPFL
jgi:hypothetical protein